MDSKKQNHKVTIFAIVLSLVSIGVLVFGFTMLSSDKVVMLQSVSNLYNKFNANFDGDTSILDMLFANNDIGINATTTIKNGEEEYIIKSDYLENISDKNTLLNLNVSLGEEEMLNGKALLTDSKLYANFSGITEDFYYGNFDYKYIIRSLDSNDYDKLASLLKSAIDSSISNKDIKKEKVNINYEGKDKKVNKLTYTINKKELKEMANELIKSIKKDKDLMKNIADVLDIKTKDLKNELDNFLKKIDKLENKNFYSYSTYYYGFNKIVQYDLYDYKSEYLFSYKAEKNQDNISVSKKDKKVFTLVKDTVKNTFTGNLDLTDSDFISEEFNEYKKNYEFTGSHKDNHLKLTVNDNTEIDLKDKSDDKTYNYVLTIKKFATEDDKKVEIYKLNSDIEIYFNKKIDIDDIELDESKKYDELEEVELNSFKDRLNGNKFYDLYLKKLLGKYFE